MMKKLLFPILVAAMAAPIMAAPKSSELTAKGPEGPLAGTLIEAKTSAPLVLIIPGSGPTDRDGNNPLGVSSSSYRMLAEALSERGITSLRIDKRGMFGSEKAADGNDVSFAKYAEDINAWIDSVQAKTPKRKCVWLLGHSEGGPVALVTAQNNPRVCGVVLAASPGRKLQDVLREQLNANPANAPLIPDAMRAIDELSAGRTIDVSKMHPALQQLFDPAIQRFLISSFATDPAKLAASLDKPLLILQGDSDAQVTAADANVLKSAQPKATLMVFDGVTHVLKKAKDATPAAAVATYTDAASPVDARLVDAIVGFVKPVKSKKR
jgi:uncharacterized protein